MVKQNQSLQVVKQRRRKYQRGYGAGIPIFRAEPLQLGYGLGGLFRGLYRSISPSLKKGLATVGKHALKTGADILEDVVVNKTPIKQAVKKQVKAKMEDMKKQIGGSKQKSINRATSKSKQVSKPKKKKQTRRTKTPRGGFQQITL